MASQKLQAWQTEIDIKVVNQHWWLVRQLLTHAYTELFIIAAWHWFISFRTPVLTHRDHKNGGKTVYLQWWIQKAE